MDKPRFHLKFANDVMPSITSTISHNIALSNQWVRLQLHGAIYRPDSFVMMLRYSANLKAIRYESMTLNRIVADKSHRVTVA